MYLKMKHIFFLILLYTRQAKSSIPVSSKDYWTGSLQPRCTISIIKSWASAIYGNVPVLLRPSSSSSSVRISLPLFTYMGFPRFSFGLVSGVSSTLKLMHFHENQRYPAGSKRALMINLWEIQIFSFWNLSGVSSTLQLLHFHEN